jgi:hypothetical protein
LAAIFLDALGGKATELQPVQVRKAAELTVAAEALRGTVLGGDALTALDLWPWLAGCACGHRNRRTGTVR